MSLRAYANRRGVSPEAVSKAVAAGRLTKLSVVKVRGQPKIRDPEIADREWHANTEPKVNIPPGGVNKGPGGVNAREPRDPPEYIAHRTAREGASARRELAQAELAELELAERKGQLIPIDQARRDVEEKFTVVRTRILGVPSRLAQRMPHLAAEVVPELDDLLREALEEIADGERDETEGAEQRGDA